MPIRRTILLVEDEDLVRNYLKDLLGKNAWVVTAVSSGNEALERLADCEFDIILCDLDLGRGPNGIDVLSRMPPRNKTKPFVILTAHGSIGRCRDAFLVGATDFLEKPPVRAVLLASLDHAMTSGAEPLVEIGIDDVVLDLIGDEAGAAHVRGAIQILGRTYSECDLTISSVAAKVGVSREYLTRLFRARLGRSPLEYLHELRISCAEDLLAHSRLSIYEVALECGYKTTSELGIWFRRLRGSTASESRGGSLKGR